MVEPDDPREPTAHGQGGTEWGEDAATFGDRLAFAREAMGLSQAQLANRMGIKLQSLQNWEEDRSEPRANRLQMLAGMLNVSMAWLMSGRGEAPAPASPAGARPLDGLVEEVRAIRLEQGRLAERLGRLEKRLRRGAA